MSRPTRTRAQLRRELAIRMMMPFAVRMPDGYGTVSAAGTNVQLKDSVNLLQPNDFWNGQWAYIMGASERVRKIVDFVQGTSLATLEYALPASLSTADTYEIHSIFNAIEMNNAINQSLEDGFPSFFDTVEDTSLIVQESKLEYDLTGLTTPMHFLHEVWAERPSTRINGTVVSATFTTPNTAIVLDEINLSNVNSDWRISCYEGEGEGLHVGVTSVVDSTNTVTVVGDFHLMADEDKVTLYDTREQYLDWARMKMYRTTPKEWPNKFHLPSTISSWLGSRLKFIYSTVPSRLTTDTATTVVPQEYILLSAMAALYGSRVGDNRVDRQRYAIMQEQYSREAELYKQMHSFRPPQTEIRFEGQDWSFQGLGIDGNPMGW